jgi:serine/threonine-protein kinase ULK/ATG1
MDLCKDGDLRKKLTKSNGKLDEKHAMVILFQLINGLKELDRIKLAHRDLKPENIFIHKDVYKIADFGFCEKYTEDKKMTFYGGTPGYSAPEVTEKVPYTKKCDIWSLGIIYYELLFGNIPGRWD